jgi:uncharacterized membrane protein YqhA
MIHKLIKTRYLFLVGVLFVLLNSVVFLIGSIIKSIEGYKLLLTKGLHDPEHRPGVQLLEGLDMFLISMVFFILAIGVLRIFVYTNHEDNDLPKWLQFRGFIDLKALLWESVIVTLVVFSFTQSIARTDTPIEQALKLPLVILVLSVSLLIVKKAHDH